MLCRLFEVSLAGSGGTGWKEEKLHLVQEYGFVVETVNVYNFKVSDNI